MNNKTMPPNPGESNTSTGRATRYAPPVKTAPTAGDAANSASVGMTVRSVDFEGHPVTAVMWRGRWCWPARRVAEAIEYQDGGKLVDQIRGPWSKEFRSPEHYEMLGGADLREFQALASRSLANDTTAPVVSKRGGARTMMVLTEAGIDLALLKSETEKGIRLRALLVEYVLPQLRATGTATLPGSESLRLAALEKALERTVALVETLAASPRLGGTIGEQAAREAIEIPSETAIELASTIHRVRQSLRRWLRNKLQGVANFSGPFSGWSNLPVLELARAQRALFGLLGQLAERARAVEKKLGTPGPLFESAARAPRKPRESRGEKN